VNLQKDTSRGLSARRCLASDRNRRNYWPNLAGPGGSDAGIMKLPLLLVAGPKPVANHQKPTAWNGEHGALGLVGGGGVSHRSGQPEEARALVIDAASNVFSGGHGEVLN